MIARIDKRSRSLSFFLYIHHVTHILVEPFAFFLLPFATGIRYILWQALPLRRFYTGGRAVNWLQPATRANMNEHFSLLRSFAYLWHHGYEPCFHRQLRFVLAPYTASLPSLTPKKIPCNFSLAIQAQELWGGLLDQVYSTGTWNVALAVGSQREIA